MKRRLTIALAGNPNSGKTTIFNNLTGARRHVGNYPGVTVEKAEGSLEFDSRILHIVDLPGTYSLTAYSIEEMAARDFILHEKPDVVIHVIDASNLERNLYLTVQLIELGAPLVLAFNMSDAAKARGVEFDLKRLSSLWGAPIVPTVGHRGHGMKDLLRAAVERAENGFAHRAPEIRYGEEIDRELALIRDWLEARGAVPDGRTAAWTALKLLEKDKHERKKIAAPELDELLAQCEARLQAILGDSPEILIAERRYGFISGACQEAVRSSVEARHDFSASTPSPPIRRYRCRFSWG